METKIGTIVKRTLDDIGASAHVAYFDRGVKIPILLYIAQAGAAIGVYVLERTSIMRECEGSFSCVNKPVFLCECGAFSTCYTDATTYYKPNYCPNCGAKVVDDGN